MVNEQIIGRGINAEPVISTLKEIPRHIFVPPSLQKYAYDDRPLPIGYDQTISQPYIVAYMTEALRGKREHTVLEIGTGCGYQTAVLSSLYKEVYSIERHQALYSKAKENLKYLGIQNTHLRLGNGSEGWDPPPDEFDRILVAAAAPKLPEKLFNQLKKGGSMIIPLAWPVTNAQKLILIKKFGDGSMGTEELLSVRFVPLIL